MSVKPLQLEIYIDHDKFHNHQEYKDHVKSYFFNEKNFEFVKSKLLNVYENGYCLSKFSDSIINLTKNINTDDDEHNMKIINYIIEKKLILNDDYIDVYINEIYDDVMENFLEENLPCTLHTKLPSKKFLNLWNTLLLDNKIKKNLLNFIYSSLKLSQSIINESSMIDINKLLLLHGPPGTGKTTLCKALCQKLSILMSNSIVDNIDNNVRDCKNDLQFHLIEINSHSLFSKWFSESGKLVLKLFEQIREFADDENNRIFLLIDEIESLTYDRQRINSSDPTDAIRVVNAMLTQIDSIKNYSNIFILSTSNVSTSMDNAFIDRADFIQYIDLPSTKFIYEILRLIINEIIDSNVIKFNLNNNNNNNFKLQTWKYIDNNDYQINENSKKLLEIADYCHEKLSGRTIKKLPYLTYSVNFINYQKNVKTISVEKFLNDLFEITKKQILDIKYFQ